MTTAKAIRNGVEAPLRAGRHDTSLRRVARRTGREAGCWVYIPAEDLSAAGIAPGVSEPVPFYRTTGRPHSRNTGTVLVRLYRER